MAREDKGHLEVEDRGAVQIVRVDGGPHAVFGLDMANQLEALVDRVDRDPSVHAVVFTGAHPERFVSHADVRWLGSTITPRSLHAEGDGNRTRLPALHRHTRFEDEGAHQAPRPLPDGVRVPPGPPV
jgi:enoyl-CoA hydratase/carnithine racemase